MNDKNEIVLYQPDSTVHLEVMFGDDTVWLTLEQMSSLFDRNKSTVSRHIKNIYTEGELEASATVAKFATVQTEGNRLIERQIEHYNLDVIISVGYRVKSQRGTQFRIWATNVLREYMFKGYAVNHRVERLERRMDGVEDKVDFFVRTALPPVEGIFFEGQIFDAYEFASKLIKSTKKRVVLIDNYVDETVLALLAKRRDATYATIYTSKISKAFQTDLSKHNEQYPPITIERISGVHDRFLIIDNTVYHIGASIKDLGKKLFAFSKMEMVAEGILKALA
jgi:hypothetical protein